MKKITTLFAAFAFIFSAQAQIATFTLSEYIPESGSITETHVMDPNFDNAFVYIMAHGLTVFNQSKEIFLVDSKTFSEKKKVDFPKYKGYDKVQPYYEEVNKNIILFFMNKPNKMNAISIVKINESLNMPDKPEYLFSLDQYDAMQFEKNEKKDLCIFTYPADNKKENKSHYHYRVYDNEMKLLKADSAAYDYKGSNATSALIYNNGYAVMKTSESKCNVTLTDIKTNKSSNFNLSNGTNTIIVTQVKSIAGDKVILLGKYSSFKNKKVNNGLFKAVYNQKTSVLEEQIYFNHVPAGKGEKDEIDKNVEKSLITETGACYFVISQGPIDSYSEYNFNNKFELVYINSASEKWKKQLPFAAKSKIDILHTKGNLYITYLDYEGESTKIDVNNYVYGSPLPSNPVTLRQLYKTNICVLKVAPNGNIALQSFIDNHYNSVMAVNNEFIGVHQGLNGQVTSKCKYFKLTDLK